MWDVTTNIGGGGAGPNLGTSLPRIFTSELSKILRVQSSPHHVTIQSTMEDIFHICRHYVTELREASLQRDKGTSLLLVETLRTSPPSVTYAAVLAASRSLGTEQGDLHLDAHSPESRWFQMYFIGPALEALVR